MIGICIVKDINFCKEWYLQVMDIYNECYS